MIEPRELNETVVADIVIGSGRHYPPPGRLGEGGGHGRGLRAWRAPKVDVSERWENPSALQDESTGGQV